MHAIFHKTYACQTILTQQNNIGGILELVTKITSKCLYSICMIIIFIHAYIFSLLYETIEEINQYFH